MGCILSCLKYACCEFGVKKSDQYKCCKSTASADSEDYFSWQASTVSKTTSTWHATLLDKDYLRTALNANSINIQKASSLYDQICHAGGLPLRSRIGGTRKQPARGSAASATGNTSSSAGNAANVAAKSKDKGKAPAVNVVHGVTEDTQTDAPAPPPAERLNIAEMEFVATQYIRYLRWRIEGTKWKAWGTNIHYVQTIVAFVNPVLISSIIGFHERFDTGSGEVRFWMTFASGILAIIGGILQAVTDIYKYESRGEARLKAADGLQQHTDNFVVLGGMYSTGPVAADKTGSAEGSAGTGSTGTGSADEPKAVPPTPWAPTHKNQFAKFATNVNALYDQGQAAGRVTGLPTTTMESFQIDPPTAAPAAQ